MLCIKRRRCENRFLHCLSKNGGLYGQALKEKQRVGQNLVHLVKLQFLQKRFLFLGLLLLEFFYVVYGIVSNIRILCHLQRIFILYQIGSSGKQRDLTVLK